MRELKEFINNQIFYMIFKTIAGLINIALMFLFYTMPIWVLILIINFRRKKDSTIVATNEEIKEGNITNPMNDETRKEGLFSFIFNKNKTTWFKSLIIIIFLSVGYYFASHASCEGLGCLVSGIILVPFILSFVIIFAILIVKLISSIVEFYHPNQKKFYIPRWIIFAIIIIFVVFNFAGPFIMGFVNKYFKQSNQINTNSVNNNESPLNSVINNEALSIFVKATFRIKDTNETFSYIEKYVPNIPDSYDYDQNAVSNCISWDLQGDFLCKKVYFIENGSDKKRLALYDEKSDAVVGKIANTSFVSEGKTVTEFQNPRKIDDLVSYTIDYKFNGENYRFQRPENLCKDDNGKVLCHEPSFKINDKVITFHITGLYRNNIYGVYPADKVIEAEMVSYQEYKYGEVSPIVNVN